MMLHTHMTYSTNSLQNFLSCHMCPNLPCNFPNITEMTSNTFENYLICRTCLSDKGDMTNIFIPIVTEGLEIKISDLIYYCASLQANNGDGLPEQICEQCLISVKSAFCFRKQCEKSDAMLRDYMVSTVNVMQGIKLEVSGAAQGGQNVTRTTADFNETNRKQQEIKIEFNNCLVNIDNQHIMDNQNISTGPAEEFCNNSSIQNNCGQFGQVEFGMVVVDVDRTRYYRYKCLTCDIRIDSLDNYNQHMFTEHNICHICGNRFEMYSLAKKHMDEEHSLNEERCVIEQHSVIEESAIVTVTKQRNLMKKSTYECLICHKTFDSKVGMKRHHQAKTYKKSYRCEHCISSFDHLCKLVKHRYDHGKGVTNEKDKMPYRCFTCRQSFCKPLVCNLQMSGQVGIEVFQCKACTKDYYSCKDQKTLAEYTRLKTV